MRYWQLGILALLTGSAPVSAQFRTVISESFSGTATWIDNSERLYWGPGPEVPHSAFEIDNRSDESGLTYTALNLLDSVVSKYSSYTLETGLKTMNCIDFEVGEISKEDDTTIIEFDALWTGLYNSGESGRIVCALLHDYPSGGAPFGAVNNVSLDHPFGRPAYHLRILDFNGAANGNSSFFMMYGGGNEAEGEVEIYNNLWWLPGFMTAAGGNVPGSGAEYPYGHTRSYGGVIASGSRWKHFTWKIYPERLEVYHRFSSEDASKDQLFCFMAIPRKDAQAISKINAAHFSNITSLPVLYNWFGSFNAIRFYFRAGRNAWLSNVSVKTTSPEPVTTVSSSSEKERPCRAPYPNPATESLTLYAAESGTVQVIAPTGSRWLSHPLNAGQNVLNVKSLPRGTFLLHLQTARTTCTYPLILE